MYILLSEIAAGILIPVLVIGIAVVAFLLYRKFWKQRGRRNINSKSKSTEDGENELSKDDDIEKGSPKLQHSSIVNASKEESSTPECVRLKRQQQGNTYNGKVGSGFDTPLGAFGPTDSRGDGVDTVGDAPKVSGADGDAVGGNARKFSDGNGNAAVCRAPRHPSADGDNAVSKEDDEDDDEITQIKKKLATSNMEEKSSKKEGLDDEGTELEPAPTKCVKSDVVGTKEEPEGTSDVHAETKHSSTANREVLTESRALLDVSTQPAEQNTSCE